MNPCYKKIQTTKVYFRVCGDKDKYASIYNADGVNYCLNTPKQAN